jgi:MFS family permease
MQAGMLVGRSALGGGALLLEQRIGTAALIILLVAIIWSSSALVLLSRETARHASDEERVRDRLRGTLHRLEVAFRSRTTWFGLLFAAIAGAGFEAVGAVAGPFMIDRGLSSDDIGGLFAMNAVIAMAAGALVGGYVADRYGKRAAVSVFLMLVVACTVGIAALDFWFSGQAIQWVTPGMTLFYFCVGLFTSSSYALFMRMTDPALGATQFSAFMGATNGCESWSAFTVGKAIPVIGYPAAFVFMGMLSLAALPLIRTLVRPVGPERSHMPTREQV